jgi:hypothetical protein
VTQIAQSAIIDGYDLFLTVDLVASLDPPRESVFIDLLVSCGVYPMTARQAILELLAREQDAARRAALEALTDSPTSADKRTARLSKPRFCERARTRRSASTRETLAFRKAGVRRCRGAGLASFAPSRMNSSWS